MSETYCGGSEGGAIPYENPAASSATGWLGLAAAPTFAIMALLTGILGGGSQDAMCSMASASPLSGMVVMYLLMSAFHSPPWLKLIGGGRRTILPARPWEKPAGRLSARSPASLTKM